MPAARPRACERLAGVTICLALQTWPFMPERVTGGHPVGVPGVLATTARLLRDRGTLTLAQALQPAIEIARKVWAWPDGVGRVPPPPSTHPSLTTPTTPRPGLSDVRAPL